MTRQGLGYARVLFHKARGLDKLPGDGLCTANTPEWTSDLGGYSAGLVLFVFARHACSTRAGHEQPRLQGDEVLGCSL